MRLLIPRAKLLEVRRAARKAYPAEYLACIWGSRLDTGELVIDRFRPIAHTGTEAYCFYDSGDVVKSKQAALRAGLEFLGTIHSHTYSANSGVFTCEHLSPDDLKTAHLNGELVSGVIYVYRGGRTTEVHWYEPKLPPEIEYL